MSLMKFQSMAESSYQAYGITRRVVEATHAKAVDQIMVITADTDCAELD